MNDERICKDILYNKKPLKSKELNSPRHFQFI